jgi:hypothetical protein
MNHEIRAEVNKSMMVSEKSSNFRQTVKLSNKGSNHVVTPTIK